MLNTRTRARLTGGIAVALLAIGAAQGAETTPLAHVEARGKGPTTLVLLPGLNCDWTVYQSFMDRNADKYTMLAVTLPGFGGSEAPPVSEGAAPSQDLWLTNAERAVTALIEEKHLTRPIVVGHSMGAHVAIRMAERTPDAIGGAVAIDGFAAFPMGGPGDAMPPDQRKAMVDTMMAPGMAQQSDEQYEAMSKQMWQTMVTDPKRAEELAAALGPKVKRATMTRYFCELMASDATPGLKELKAPLLVVAALPKEGDAPFGADTAQTKAMWEAQFKDAKNTTVVYVADSRHFVMDDQPAKLDEAVAKFVEGLKKK